MSKANRSKRPKSSGETSEPDTAVLVPQPHGGALRVGGKPGNRGGGRLPSQVREAALAEVEKRVPLLASFVDGVVRDAKTKDGEDVAVVVPVSVAERVQAFNALVKIAGLDGRVAVAEIATRLEEQARVLVEMLPADMATAVLDRLEREVWR